MRVCCAKTWRLIYITGCLVPSYSTLYGSSLFNTCTLDTNGNQGTKLACAWLISPRRNLGSLINLGRLLLGTYQIVRELVTNYPVV
ncbi:hypothetical protein F4782DRAFT_494048 [Xylaria castorea]|nr:hypothetical protein F4782DRAFT_494048 [Xylaria castorea]